MTSTSAPTIASPIVASYTPVPDAALVLADESARTKVIIRAAAGTPARATLAQPFGGSRSTADVLIAGIRPDEWIVLGDASEVNAWVTAMSSDGHVSEVDWTHGRAQFRLTGERATSALEKVCGLDWSDPMTPDGAATSGSVAKVTCDIIRNDIDGVPSYLILCDRSFGQYLFDALLDAGDEFTITAEL